MRWLLTAILALGLALFGTACQGEEGKGEATITPAATATRVASATPGATATRTATATGTPSTVAAATSTAPPTAAVTGEAEAGPPPNAECWLHQNEPKVDPCSDLYMPGQVIVGFKRDVTRAQAVALIESYGLSFDPMGLLTDLWVKVDSGPAPSGALPPLDEVVEELTRNEVVKEVRPQCYGTTAGTDRCITVDFTRPLTSEEVAAFVASFPGLTLVEDFTLHRWTLVCVEPGRESDWIDTFQAQDAVEYAERNGIARIPEACDPSPTAE